MNLRAAFLAEPVDPLALSVVRVCEDGNRDGCRDRLEGIAVGRTPNDGDDNGTRRMRLSGLMEICVKTAGIPIGRMRRWRVWLDEIRSLRMQARRQEKYRQQCQNPKDR